jgi:hypothetical protein
VPSPKPRATICAGLLVVIAGLGAVAVIDAAPAVGVDRQSVPVNATTPADTDGDGLPDEWERRAGFDPRHKTLPVVVRYTGDSEPLDAAEKRRLREIFARMPVANPDGDAGIRLRFRHESRTDRRVAITHSALERYERRYAQGNTTADPCREQLLVVAQSTAQIGRAAAPGRVALVQSGQRVHGQPRTTTVVHELLHTIVGRLPTDNRSVADRWHTTTGWLRAHDEQPRLSAVTAAQLDTGFAIPAVCRPA